MALIWMDGFDHYGASNSNFALAGYSYSGSVLFDASIVRTGSHSAYSELGNIIKRPLPSAKTAIGVAIGMYREDLPATNDFLFVFNDTDGTRQVVLWVTAAGNIRATRGDNFTIDVLGESSPVISTGAWNHVEAKVVFSNSVGAIEVRVNEVTVLNLTGIDTVSDGATNVSCSEVGFFSDDASVTRVDDFFIWDTSGSENNDFIGDRRVVTLLPNANAATQGWTVSGAANAYTAIQTANGDTSYITATSSVPVTSEFDIENPGAEVGAIAAVQTSVLARKTDAGSNIIQMSMLSGGDVAAGASQTLTTSYAYKSDVFETDPDTGAPWTPSSLAAAQLRIRRTT